MAATSKPPFITFEGGEGAGKSTQIKMLQAWLQSRGCDVVATREPGGTPGSELLRNLIVQGDIDRWDRETETLLFMAARRDLLSKVTWPALAQGSWVLCDRFVDSTYAYQSYGRGLKLADLQALYQFAGGGFMPDLTFLLDIEPRQGLDRVLAGKDRNVAEDRYESFDIGFHERLRAGYHALAAAEPQRFLIIDATLDRDAVQSLMQDEIGRRFGL